MSLSGMANFVVFVLLGFVPMAVTSNVRAAEPERINVCYSSIAATSITTWVPYEAGIYKKYGLDVRIIYVAGAQAITTLVSGDTQIVQGSGAAAALSRLSGSDVTIIGTTINVIPMEHLRSYSWPGNARQLENEIKRLVVSVRGKTIGAEQLDLAVETQKMTAQENPTHYKGKTIGEVVEAIEQRMIQEALLKAGGNKAKAAEALGLSRQGLLKKIKRLAITP